LNKYVMSTWQMVGVVLGEGYKIKQGNNLIRKDLKI
jgi:hypothetical protein